MNEALLKFIGVKLVDIVVIVIAFKVAGWF